MLQECSPAPPAPLQPLAALTAASCGGPLLVTAVYRPAAAACRLEMNACRKKGLRLELLMLYIYVCKYIYMYVKNHILTHIYIFNLLILFLVKEEKGSIFLIPPYKGKKKVKKTS